MTTIIALKGRHQSGKTPTLKLLEQVVCDKYTSSVKILHEERDIGGSKDIFVIIEINGSMTVGIYSLGDYATSITTNLQIAVSMQCDIIFCACRTRSSTVLAIQSFASSSKIVFVKRDYETSLSKQELVNKKQVYDLMKFAQL